jgi:hypothetical protein
MPRSRRRFDIWRLLQRRPDQGAIYSRATKFSSGESGLYSGSLTAAVGSRQSGIEQTADPVINRS